MVMGQSILIESALTGIGAINAVTPKTNARLQILEPITFPIVMSGLPAKAAWILINSSGAEVPKATIVTPTTKGDIFKRKAILEAPLTSNSPPRIRTARPTKSNMVLDRGIYVINVYVFVRNLSRQRLQVRVKYRLFHLIYDLKTPSRCQNLHLDSLQCFEFPQECL